MMLFKFENIYSEEFIKNFSGFSAFQLFDVQPLLEIQKKNFEAFTEAGKLVLEGLQGATQRQSEFLSQAITESSAMVKDIVAEGAPEQKIAQQTALTKKCYEQSVTNWRELTEIVNKSGKQAADIIQGRVASSLMEYRGVLHKIEGAKKSDTAKKAA
jgi:phasin family protein